jgi:hypothetical protein
VFVCDKCSLSDKTAEIMVIPVSSSASVSLTGYGCKNWILPLVLLRCCVKAFMCRSYGCVLNGISCGLPIATPIKP